MMPRSITSRLVFFYCVLLVLLGGAFAGFTILSFKYYTRESIARNLVARTREIWNTSEGMLDKPERLAEVIGRRFSPESQDRFIRIRVNGKTIYRSAEPAGRSFSAARAPMPDARRLPLDILRGNLILYSARFEDRKLGPVIIDCGQSYQFARSVQGRLQNSLFIGLPALLLLAALAGYMLMRRALTPIEAMINAAEAYTFNDPHKRLPLIGAEPRIEALGLALNRMLDRLDSAYSHVSRFSADAAHELRTPLTIIRGELELLMSQSPPQIDVERALGSMLEEMNRLGGIVDSLITLSRMESMWGKNAHSLVDLQDVAAETIDQLNLLAVEKSIRLVRVPGPAVTVAGDRDRLKQVLVNLLDNAIKYTRSGGGVTVTAHAGGDKAVIQVEDTGIGIDPDHHDRIFDRFYRILPDRGEAGAGLGLAIVKSICHAHGGTVMLRSARGGGSCFTVELPLWRSQAPLPDTGQQKIAATRLAIADP